MIDPELKTILVDINANLIDLKKKSSGGLGRSFLKGLLNALGYMIGILLSLAIFYWYLNSYGYLDSIKVQLQNIQTISNEMKQLNTSANSKGYFSK